MSDTQGNGNRATFESVEEFARAVGISRQAAYNGLRKGAIPHIRLGKRFIIPKAAIEEWLRSAGKQQVA